jgi:teichuronic acid exporter
LSNSALKKGFFWSFLDSVSVQIITFIFGIILARLLSPKEFGIIGMVMVFIAVSNIFVSSGFSDALMRKKEIKPIELNTVFWFNLSISIILYVLLYGGAGVISNFFETPLLIDVIRLLGLGIIINALILVQRVILTKQMDFKTLTKISVSSTLFSGACAIIMAYQGYGVWSLVAKTLIAQLVTLILMVLFNSWRPQVKFDFIVFKGMFTFGSRLLLLGLLDTLYSNIY